MSGFPSETGGDRLAHQRAQMIHALNGHEVDADTAWAIIHRWDALVEVAKAARDIPDMDTPETDALYRALARLDRPSSGRRADSGATEEDA